MFKVGDYIQYNHVNGSVGTVVGVRDDGPFKAKPHYYVQYVYGRDKRGEIMKESGGLLSPEQLRSITEAEYLAIRDREGFGDQTD